MGDGTILVTGSCGLIGRAVMRRLTQDGHMAVGIDLRDGNRRYRVDICRHEQLAPFMEQATGVIHLAAVARVGEAEADPRWCRAVNVEATRDLLNQARRSPKNPWVLYAGSREIYGDQPVQPVGEDALPAPKNVYARSKYEAEELMEAARRSGLGTAILRFANVYGDTNDYSDRVIPAFATVAARGGTMRVDDPGQTLDFTHIDDVADGVARVVERLILGETTLPPVHLASGTGTTLLALARLAQGLAHRETTIEIGAARPSTVNAFVGDTTRARKLLDWQASTPLDRGLASLIDAFAGAAEEPGEANRAAAS